jgi:hypothetical protein
MVLAFKADHFRNGLFASIFVRLGRVRLSDNISAQDGLSEEAGQQFAHPRNDTHQFAFCEDDGFRDELNPSYAPTGK